MYSIKMWAKFLTVLVMFQVVSEVNPSTSPVGQVPAHARQTNGIKFLVFFSVYSPICHYLLFQSLLINLVKELR